MSISKLVGEGVNGKHLHNYENSASGHWEWCADCRCMVTSPCLHNEYMPCYERSTYIRLKRKYEAVEHGVQADTCQDHAWNETHTGFKFCPDCGQPLSSPQSVRGRKDER